MMRRNGKGSRREIVGIGVSCSWVFLVLVAFGLPAPGRAAESSPAHMGDLTVVGVGGAEAEVVVDYFSGDVVRNAAAAFVDEVHRRTGVALPIRDGKPAAGKLAIHIGKLSGNAQLKGALETLGLQPVTANQPGREGFLLASSVKGGNPGIAVVDGCDDLGTFHGVGWLLRNMRFPEGRALIPLGLKVSTAPVSWQRRMIFESNAGYANASIEGFRNIWTDYIFWGLSAISTSCDPAQQGDPRESDFSRYLWDKWADSVRLTKSLGLDMVHVTQTNMVAKEGEFGPARIENFAELNYKACNSNGVNPKFPRAREVLKASRKWFFEHLPYADEVDYITSGWDTGGVSDTEPGPWSIEYMKLVDTMIAPLIFQQNPKAKVLLRVYFVPEFKLLAEKLSKGWTPKSVYGIEFSWFAETEWAHLVPEQYKRIFLPINCTDFFFYGAIGANCRPRFHESEFDYVWNKCGIKDGTGAYSEGVHEYVNHIIWLQKAWDPKRSVDRILDEICRYYFGEEAAPILKEAFLLMEQEEPEILDDPKVDPKLQELVAKAEPLLPGWARSSRQWAVVVGRAGIDRTRRRQADLLSDFDQRWQEYESLLKPDAARPADAVDRLIAYFQSIADNAWELERIYKRLDRDGYGIQGGNQIAPVWPDPRTAEAIEALGALKRLKQSPGPVAPTRWCVAFVDQNAQVCVSDGYGNFYILQSQQAADAQLVIADLGDAHNEVIFLSPDGRLYRWSPLEPAAKVLAEGQFLTGPLAGGDLNGDGKDELVVLTGTSAEDSSLAVVDAHGKTVALNARPSGQAPDGAMNGINLLPPNPPRTAKTGVEPRVRICDVDADGKLEVAYSDRDRGGQIVVVDIAGNQKLSGPAAPAGVLATGDLDGDGPRELVYLDAFGYLAVFSQKNGALKLGEQIKPKWKSSVVVARIGDRSPEVVYADQDGCLRGISLGQQSRRLASVSDKTAAVGPGLVTGDFNGDGRGDVCCLRSHRWWDYPLATLAYLDEAGGYRDFSVSSRNMQTYIYAAPLGPRAAGLMSVPAIHKSYQKEFGKIYRINWYNCGDLDPVFESYTLRERKKSKQVQ